jgi:hypothetical protein
MTTSTDYNSALTGLHVRSSLRPILVKPYHFSDFFGWLSFAICFSAFLLCNIWTISLQGSR